jgi:folate-binding protein YgfZ
MSSVISYEYSTRTHLLVSDEDAADFLQSQFTNELRPFEQGRCTYGLWLDVKGKVLGDSYVLCDGDEQFRLISELSDAATLVQKLESHIIADDVVIETAPDLVGFALVGAEADAVLSALSLKVPAAGSFESGSDCLVLPGRRARASAYEVLCLTAAAVDRVRAVLSQEGVGMVSADRMADERIAAGYPLVPVEVGPSDLPGEGGLESDAISFTKGCYLGQEVVARMHNVGRPQRTLFVVSGSGEAPACPLAIYNGETKQIGELRTAVATEAGWQGVAMLKHRFASVGDVMVSDTGKVSVERILRESKKG